MFVYVDSYPLMPTVRNGSFFNKVPSIFMDLDSLKEVDNADG